MYKYKMKVLIGKCIARKWQSEDYTFILNQLKEHV